MSKLPKYWVKVEEPEAGLYEIAMVTGWSPMGVMKDHKCLYVVKSLEGYLNECIEPNTEIPSVWHPHYG